MSTLAPDLAQPGHVPLVEVVVTGALDAAAVPRLRDLLDEALALRPERLVVDVARSPRIDPAAIRVLLRAHRQAARNDGRLVVREASAKLHRDQRLAHVADELYVVSRITGIPLSSERFSAAWNATTDAPAIRTPRRCGSPPALR